MNQMKLRCVMAAVAGTLALGVAAPALADTSSDVIYTLMAKGVLTEEEGHQLLDGRDKEVEAEKKAQKSAGRLTIAEFIDNATVYGDIRVRAEHRDGEDAGANSEDRDRGRYKVTFGIKTKANDFYTDLAFAMGAGGRSDNATFGKSNGGNDKEALFVKRAMVGWKATDWLTLEAGRMANPLYTTEMVWDKDLTLEGVSEQFNFKTGNAELFATLVQSQYLGDDKNYSPNGYTYAGSAKNDAHDNFLLAFQGGVKYAFTDSLSAKAALTYTTYTHDRVNNAVFTPAAGTSGTTAGANVIAINDLRMIEVPWELNMKGASTLTYSLFGDYVHNLDGDDRANHACAAATGANKTAVCAAGDDSNAWMLGVGLKSAQGKKPQKGDWAARLWYQNVGMYSVDPNTVDSDFMDSRVNMKGVVLKGEYNLRDNVFVNVAAGHATRKEDKLSAAGTGDIDANLDKYNLYQLDLTYKF